MIYDPYQPPDPDEWLELPEMDRITLVLDYHQGTKEELPNPTPLWRTRLPSAMKSL